MLDRGSIGALVLAAAPCLSQGRAFAFDDAQYPDFCGKWNRAPTPCAPRTPQPVWREAQCANGSYHVLIGQKGSAASRFEILQELSEGVTSLIQAKP
jgi:hypothetical protein